jgi:predicted HicB family RNase H-like nuclease
MKPSDRYLKIVEWSQEDGCYVGTCPGLMLGGVHGPDETKVYRELCQVVEEWIRIYEEDGEPLPAPTAGKEYSGKFVVRVGRDLHKELAIEAIRSGKSLNSYCVDALRERGPTYGGNKIAGPTRRNRSTFRRPGTRGAR